jgi:hypothetical protein
MPLSICGHRCVSDRTASVLVAIVLIAPFGAASCGLRSSSGEGGAPVPGSSAGTGTIETIQPSDTSIASSTVPATVAVTTTVDPVAVKATITANWERFFDHTTAIADRVALLENGPSLQQALEQRSKDPLQQQASAKVKAIELVGTDRASVTYDVLLNGIVALGDSVGYAVFQDGVWKVAAESFCALISLGATAPIPGCS